MDIGWNGVSWPFEATADIWRNELTSQIDSTAANEKRLHEIHDYIRHIFQLFMGWFTVFVTVNFVTIGWLATSEKNGAYSAPPFASVVPVMLILQNLLGVLAAWRVYVGLRRSNNQVADLEGIAENETSVPIRLYSQTLLLVIAALIITVGAWISILALMSK
jgi:hypothetical protein